MYHILFVCYGNICRSPMAEMLFKDIIYKNNKRYKFSCISRATSVEELGNSIYPEAASKLREKGVLVEAHKAKQITKEEYEKYDYILVMEEKNRKDLISLLGEDSSSKIHLLMEYTSQPKDIPDPWYTGDFESAFQDIYEGCMGLYHYLLEKED